jgi:hypothetical protein
MANTYLTHTNSGTGSYQKSTFSAWVKRSSLGATQCMWNNVVQAGVNQLRFEFNASDQIYLYGEEAGGYALRANTTALYRDTSAWYNIVVAIDTTQGTASDRIKLYVNGVQVTLTFSTTPAVNANLRMNYNSTPVYVGSNATASYFNGSMSHVHWIDGTAYPASTFGSVDATSGIWTINTSPSITMGTNGFTILKDGNTITDQSSNSNNFSLGGGTLTKTQDCPDNNFATMNPLDNFYSGATFSNGNNTVATISASTNWVASTLQVSSGKWYAECKPTAGTASALIGFAGSTSKSQTVILETAGLFGGNYVSNGEYFFNGSGGAYASSFANGDIISVYLDLDNNFVYFAKNGALQYSGDPTSGATGTGGKAITASASTTNGSYAFACGDGNTATRTFDWNFGNGFFGTTAVTTNSGNGYAGTDGKSIFNYQPPTGYSALSTKGLNL